MALDLDVVKQELEKLNSKQGSNDFGDLFLKLEAGDTRVRIVPNKYGKSGWPFIGQYIYYFTKPSLISAKTFQKEDIILKFVKELYSSKDSDDIELAKRLSPTKRILVPVIVRSEEVEGKTPKVKYWNFSERILKEILVYASDPEYGDIADEKTGTDIIITKQTPKEAGNQYGNTKIRFARKPSMLADSDAECKAIVDSVVDIQSTALFKEQPEEKYREALEKYIDYKKEGTPTNEQTVKESKQVISKKDEPTADTGKENYLDKFKNLLKD